MVFPFLQSLVFVLLLIRRKCRYYELDLVYHWTLHSKTLIVNWSQPTLETIFTNPSVTTFPDDSNVIEVNGTDQWTYWIIQDESAVNAYHPMHLHGHDFYILAQGSGIFDPDLATLNTVNPPRRDTATMQGTGYLVIAFLSDNPGCVSLLQRPLAIT